MASKRDFPDDRYPLFATVRWGFDGCVLRARNGTPAFAPIRVSPEAALLARFPPEAVAPIKAIRF
jgi:hypothetical protein